MISSKQTQYRIISASATLFILLGLYAILQLSSSIQQQLMPLDVDNEEFVIPLEDDLTADLSESLSQESEQLSDKTNKATEQITSAQPDQPAFTENTRTDITQKTEEEAEMEKSLRTPKEAPKPLIAAAVKDTVKEAKIYVDSTFLAAIKTFTNKEDKTAADKFKSRQERIAYYKKNYRAIYNFLKVYPYAVKTKEIIDKLNARLATMTDEGEKKKLIKQTEKELFDQYEKAIRNMSYSQGKVLLKLIARETNMTTFDIIKNYKGTLSANFWNSVGKLFGANLKTEYHKEKEDSVIEKMLQKHIQGDF